MRLKKLILKNFKGYQEAEIDFDDMSIVAGKNDAGKSTILHALDLFFNPKEANKTDIFYKNDNMFENEVVIECSFNIGSDEIKLGGEDNEILVTETNLLGNNQSLIIGYKYTQTSIGKSPFYSENYIRCSNYNISNQTWSKNKVIVEQMRKEDLNGALKSLSIDQPQNVDGRENHWKRKALENYIVSNYITPKEDIIISLSEKSEKERLSPVIDKLPKFKLFSNDKHNSINEKENSKIIESEIKEIIAKQMAEDLEKINRKMQDGMREKLQKLNDTYKTFFNFLGDDSFTMPDGKPSIDFKTNGIIDKKGLSVENRGSGFRRLALLSLHLSAHTYDEYKDIIFAIEEPETSQNPHNQRGVIKAMKKLMEKGSQVVITTHSPAMVREFSDENIKYNVVKNDGTKSEIVNFQTDEELFDEIINLLGVLPLDMHGKKLIVFVEGLHDEAFLKKIEKDIFNSEQILFVPIGGKYNFEGYISAHIFKSLRLPYGAVLDKKSIEQDNTENKMIKGLKNVGYENNSITTGLTDITKYLNGFSGEKKGMHEKIRAIEKLTEIDVNNFQEVTDWFNKFKEWMIVPCS